MTHCNRDKFNYFWICEPLARCAKRGSSLPLGTPMEIDFTSAYLHYPLPQCSKIVTPIIFSISYELFRLPSAKVSQDYQLLRTFVWKVDPEQWAISWYDFQADEFDCMLYILFENVSNKRQMWSSLLCLNWEGRKEECLLFKMFLTRIEINLLKSYHEIQI